VDLLIIATTARYGAQIRRKRRLITYVPGVVINPK